MSAGVPLQAGATPPVHGGRLPCGLMPARPGCVHWSTTLARYPTPTGVGCPPMC